MAERQPWHALDEEIEGEEEANDFNYSTQKDAVLFAVEINAAMVEGQQKSVVLSALSAAKQLMQRRLISHPRDMMGVLLFGTKSTKFGPDDSSSKSKVAYPHCYLLLDLCIPAAEDVKSLQNIIEDVSEATEILTPSKEPVLLSNVLFCANQIFSTRAANFTSKRLFIVTNNDNPHPNNKQLKSAATVRAKDLYDLGITVDLFPISSPKQPFDKTLFYDDIIYQLSSLESPEQGVTLPVPRPVVLGDSNKILESLLSEIDNRTTPRRALFSNMPLEIAPGLSISVNGYTLFKKQEIRKSCYVHTAGERPEIATAHVLQLDRDTDKVLKPEEVKRAYNFGGAQIVFSKEEVSEIKHFGPPGIKVIGFKDRTLIPFWANMKPATFVYPSEEGFIGSTRTFAALRQKLDASEKIALIWYIARRNATPSMAALLPGNEEQDSQGKQIFPPGMWLAPLPFADDIRQMPMSSITHASPATVDEFRTIIQQLQLPGALYAPSKYPNPVLQWHYHVLSAIALDEEMPQAEKSADKTIPRYRQIEKRIKANVAKLQHQIGEDTRTQGGKSQKRTGQLKTGDQITKRAKTDAS